MLVFYSKVMSPLTGPGTPTPCPGEWVPLIQDSLAQSHCCLLPRALELASGDMEDGLPPKLSLFLVLRAAIHPIFIQIKPHFIKEKSCCNSCSGMLPFIVSGTDQLNWFSLLKMSS